MAKDILDDTKDDSEDTLMGGVPDEIDAVSVKNRPGKLKQLLKTVFGSKKILLLLILLVAAAGLAAGTWFFFFKSPPEKETEAPALESETMPEVTREDEVIFEDILDLAPFERIPLKPGSPIGQINITLSLELTDAGYRETVFSMQDRIRQIISGQLSETSWLELRNPEGKIMLKYTLLKRINALFPRATVRNIYFTYLIMQ